MDLRLNLQELKTPEDIQKLVSAISEMADNLDVLVSTVAPNSNISGRQGQICLYNNSSVYTVWICTGSTVWQQVGAGDMSYANTRIKRFTFTRDVSLTGDQVIDGIGFTPTGLVFVGSIGSTSAMCIGITGVVGTSGGGGIIDKNPASAGTYADTSLPFALYTANGVYAEGYVSAYGSDGFTITWTKTGSPTGTATFYGLAFR